MSPEDRQRLLDEEAARKGQAVNNVAMSGRDPVLVARAKRMERVYGVPSPLIEADPKPFEQQLERDKADVTVTAFPWMVPKLASDADLAAMISGEDLAKTGAIVSAFSSDKPKDRYSIDMPRESITARPLRDRGPESRVTGPTKWSIANAPARVATQVLGAFGEAATRTAQGVMGAAELAADVTGFNDETDAYFRQQDEVGQRILANMRPEWLQSGLANDIQSGLASTIQMLLPLPFGKAALLPVLAGTTGFAAYSKYQGRGAGIGASLLGAGAEGAIEYATEKMPIGYLTSKFGKGSAREFLTHFVLGEVAGEQLATAGQDAVDTAIANPSKTWGDYWKERPEAMLSTLVATLTTSAIVGGAGQIHRRFANTVDAARDSNEALIGQTLLDHAMTGAAAVELRAGSPEDFAKFVSEGAKNSPVKNVYIPIEAIEAAMADETLPEEEKAALRFYQDQIEEARLNNGEVVIPIGDALASFAGSKVWQSLKDDARVLAGGISGREAREKLEGITAELEAIGNQAFEEAAAAAPQLEAKAQVYNEVKAQMVAAGRSDKEAQTTAALFASRAETLATERYGQFKSPLEAWKWMQLQIVGDGAKVPKGKKVAQAAGGATVNIGLDVPDGSKLTVDEAVAALREQGVEITAQEVRQSATEQTLIASLSHALTAEQAHAVSVALRQEAIAQKVGDTGELHGPEAAKWGAFNPEFFLDPTDTAGATTWSPDRVDGLIKQFGNEDGTSTAVAVMMSPDQFLGLTASSKGRALVAERVAQMDKYGQLDVAKLLDAAPITLTVSRGGEPSNVQRGMGIERLDDRVMAHDGRHRMEMLRAAGVTQVPVVVVLQDGKKQALPDAPTVLRLAPQRSKSDQVANGDIAAFDVAATPIAEAFRDALSGAQTLQQSSLPEHEIPSSIQGVLEIARSQKFANQRDFKLAVQKAVNAYRGNKRDRKRLFRLAINDARVALQNNANAVGWYDEKVEQALAVFATIHPEIESDPDARFAFIYALAVTSNGLRVNRNFELADEVYREWKATGVMPMRGEGNAQRAMETSLGLFNRLTQKFGFEGLHEIMMRRDITVEELGELTGVTISGEHKGTKVTGAAFLGPKIGNGFFSNLYGNFDQLTMDRWFIRTWGRWTGTLITEDKAKIKAKRDTVKALLKSLTPAQIKAAEKALGGYKIKLTDIDGFAKRVYAATTAGSVRDALNAIHPRLRLDPKALFTLLDGQKEIPYGPAERNEIRSIMVPVLEHLREDNPALTMADLQAVLWYPEKTLYTTATSGGETAVGYEDDEAPDYANAAVALARAEGVPQEKIDEALKAASERAGDRAYVAQRARGAGRDLGATVPGFDVAEDGAGFPLEDGLVSEGDGTTDPMTLQQFGGRKAVLGLAAQSRMMRAAELEAQGETAEEIWDKTGWLRADDGKWRFEISDLTARLTKFEPSEKTDRGALSEDLETVLAHPKLYFHYPHLAQMPVIVIPLKDGVRGYFAGTHIALASDMSKEEALSTLLHEIQHAIQTFEGFTNGANAAPKVLEEMGLGPALDAQVAFYDAINNGEVPGWSFPEKLTSDQIEATAAHKVYMRVLGEAEARTVQRRLAWTAADRAVTFPDFAADLDGESVLVPTRNIQDTGAAAMSQGPRGEATFFPSGKTVVQLFGKADFSTMLHEMSHVFLQQEFTLAKAAGASEELKADIAALTAWFEANGGKLDAKGMPDREAHELFARTGERYFREGKAPSAELRPAFTQFKAWLTGVYKSVKDLLVYGPAPINPEIREIMDRMIATAEAIDVNATAPMTQEQLGMTTAEYAAYLDSVSTARDAAHDALLERMMKAIRNRETGRLREQRANVRAEVAEEVNADPRFIALHLLRTGRWLGDPAREATPVKIHTGWLIDNYGEEVLKQLPVGLQPLHRGDGIVGDDIAELVGMASGDALVRVLLDLKVQADQLKADGNPRPLRDQIIEDETNRIMAERHGDIALSEEEIEEEAIAALNSARQGEVLATELRQLKKTKGTGGIVTPYQLLREWARRKVNEGTVADAVSKSALQRYIRGFNKARNAFENAILANDNNEAIKQKQAQMINHALLAEGKVVADEINKIVRRMQRYARTKALASIDQDYMDRIHELLEGYSFRNVSDRQRAEQASFETWAEGQRALGHEVLVPARFRDERTNWKDARVAKLLELNDMVQSLAAQGKLKQRLLTAQGERELAATIDTVESSILALPPRSLPASSTGEEQKPFMQAVREDGYRRAVANLLRPGGRVREMAAGLVKMEGLFDILEGSKDGTGPLNQLVLRGATDAANEFSRLTEEVMGPIIARYKAMSSKQSARLRDFVTINELTLNVSIHEADTEKLGQPLTIPRMKLIGLLLNTGNLSNLAKLVGGERWGDPESAADMARVRDILVSYASKEDMDLVQDIWNGVSKLWPHIARVERELSGVVPEEVVPMAFDTPHGPYTGGYWPVVWDSTRSEMGKKQGEEAETSLQGVGFGISTPKGHTITRTGAAAPMEWSVEHVLFGHMNKVISRIAYAPWVRDTLKIVDNPRVTGAIRLRLGGEYVKAIKPWIRDQIPSNTPDVQGAKSWERVLNQVRVNMSICVLGVSYTTGVAQTLGLGYSAGVVGEGSVKDGAKWIGTGILKMLQLQKHGATGAQEFVFARSEEMKRRAHEVNQESAEVFRRLRDQDTPVRKLQAAAFWHIGFIDLNMVAIPTWMGGYHKALAQGLSEQEAIDYAEKVVRLSQGSGRAKDLSAIQRGNAGQKFIAMFYTPSSVFFSQQWDAVQQVKAGNWSEALAPTFWFLTMTTIADAMMGGDWPEDDDKDGLGGMDIAEWVARNMAFGMFYGVPIARDVSNTAERQMLGKYAEYGTTPLSFGMQLVGKGIKAGKKIAEGEALEGKDVKGAAAAMGFLMGLPGNQVGKTAGYVKDVYDGKVQPQGVGDWYQGLTSGKQSEQ